MIERPTPSDPAEDPRPDALLQRHRAVTAADQVLADVLTAAHASTTAALRRLDEIEADLQALVDNQHELGLDTPAGVREVQRLLAAKQRQIVSIVSDAADEGDATKAALQELSAQYSVTSGPAAV